MNNKVLLYNSGNYIQSPRKKHNGRESFKECDHACMLSLVRFFATPWTVSHQPPLVHGIFQARILEWVAISFSRGSSQPRDQTHVSCVSCIWQGLYLLSHLGSSKYGCDSLKKITEKDQNSRNSQWSILLQVSMLQHSLEWNTQFPTQMPKFHTSC